MFLCKPFIKMKSKLFHDFFPNPNLWGCVTSFSSLLMKKHFVVKGLWLVSFVIDSGFKFCLSFNALKSEVFWTNFLSFSSSFLFEKSFSEEQNLIKVLVLHYIFKARKEICSWKIICYKLCLHESFRVWNFSSSKGFPFIILKLLNNTNLSLCVLDILYGLIIWSSNSDIMV